jgi:S-DNA-T family DNA segregation ATPase FtsK/SpoIIIE
MAKKADLKDSKQKANKDTFFSRMGRFFADQRTRYGLGILLIGLVAYSGLAFLSHFFTGAADQSSLNTPFWELKTTNNDIQNWAGPLGAYIAEFFIDRCFGIASFAGLFLLMVFALRLMKVRVMALWKAMVYSSVILIWLSVFISYFFYSFYAEAQVNWGGEHGNAVSEWLQNRVGSFGTFLIITATFLVFAIFTYKGTIPLLQKIFQSLIVFPLSKLFSKKEPAFVAPLEDGFESVSFPEEEVATSDDNWIVSDAPDEEFEIHVPQEEDRYETVPEEEVPFELNTVKTAPDDNDESYDASELGDYDPTLDLSKYRYPTVSLLKDYGSSETQVNIEEQNSNKNRIITTLSHYGIEIDKIQATVGPTITLYEIIPKPGVRISKIRNLESDIMLSLAATGIRIIAPIPGKGTIGIEVPNNEPQVVSIQSIIASKKFQESKYSLPIAFGRTITNDIFMVDLCKMPHLLVAGATGQGKSVGLNAIITSLLYKKHPSQLKFVLIDPKKVEFNIYSDIEKHFLAKLPDGEDAIITDVTKVVQTLNSLTKEMDDRYDLLKKAHVRNITEYNDKFIHRRLNPEKGHRFMPYIVVIIDEFGDLIMVAGKEVELPIARIAQLARAVGIHMIIATQRPSVNIITGVIKANFPARVAFRVSSQIDSRTILDTSGANQLVGRGDMLFSQGSDLIRVQCAFVDTPEVENVTKYIAEQQGYATAFYLPEYVGPEGEGTDLSDVDLSKKDPLFEEAARLLVAHQQGSTSLIQRKFSIGYNRAGRIVDQLEAAGIIGPFEGSKARQVLVQDEYHLEQIFAAMK